MALALRHVCPYGRTVYLLNIAIRATLNGFIVGCPACKQVRGNRLVLPLTCPHSGRAMGLQLGYFAILYDVYARKRHKEEIGENAVQTRTDCALPVLYNGFHAGLVKKSSGLLSIWR